MDIRDKIKKLLKLANSSNENEAKAALKKAQELMAKHKIEKKDIGEEETKVERKYTGIKFTNYKDCWKADLMDAIATNYCCDTYMGTLPGKRTHELGLIGFPEDIEICIQLFNFAAQSVEKWYKEFKKENEYMYNSKYLNAQKNVYGAGFATGIDELLKKQFEEKKQEWGLVMATPPEVTEFIKSLDPHSGEVNICHDPDTFAIGVKDGRNADIQNKLSKYDF